jgi:HK97 family phage prohead protease
METRLLSPRVELREKDKANVLVGTPVVYNMRSELLFGYFHEYILPQAFREHLDENPDVFACVQHDETRVLGRRSANTLLLEDGDDALHCEIILDDTTYAVDLMKSVRRGDIRGMSFSFDVVTDEWRMVESIPTRTVKKARLYEVSPVTNPAYNDTSVALKRCKEFIESGAASLSLHNADDLRRLRQRLNECSL